MKTTDKKTKNVEKNIHEGHRERLLNLALNADLDNLSEVQLVEFFLTYIFPRGDVNPLAHRLLDEFESFSRIVDAEPFELVRVNGINERSAKRIHLFGQLFFAYSCERMSKQTKLETVSDVVDIVEDNLRFRNTENLILLALSPGNVLIGKRRVTRLSVNDVGIPMFEVSNFLSSTKASSLVVAHCHPFGRAIPSADDKNAFNMMENLCVSLGVNLFDSYIVGEDGIFSQRENKLLRRYIDVEELNTAFKVVK